MIEALGYLWLRPLWLALIPLALVLGIWLTRRSGWLGAWERAVDPALMTFLRRTGRVLPGGRTRAVLPACVLAESQPGLVAVRPADPGCRARDPGACR